MPVSAMKKEKKEKTYDSDDSSTDGSPRGSIAMRRKTISWRYSRTPSPVPLSSATPAASGRKSRGTSPLPTASSRRASRTPSPVPRSMSEPIRLANQQSGAGGVAPPLDSPPPLPYNIKAKKRNARRIQSIHHMAEYSGSSPTAHSYAGASPTAHSSSDPDRSEEERSPRNKLFAVNSTTDPGTTSDSGSSWRRSAQDPVSTDENSSTGTPSIISKSKTMLVPCRLNENSVIDLSMLPKPFTPKDQLRLAMLLSTQETKYGFNMFDALIPGDNEEITRLMSMGIRYEDAVLIIFEKRYVTKPHEGLRSSPIPIPEYKPHSLSSIPAPAAVQLSEELSRSMSPKPRPQSMPLTSSRSPRDLHYHNNNNSYDNNSLGYSRESSRTPPPMRHHSMGHPPAPGDQGPGGGDYGLSQSQYPGYVTLRPGSIGNSQVNSRSHSPHPSNLQGSELYHNHNHQYYSRYPGSSLETSRTITPNPPFAHLNNNNPPPLTSLHGQPSSSSYQQYSSRSSRNQSPYHSGLHSRSYSPLPTSHHHHPVDTQMPPKSYSFSQGTSRSHSPRSHSPHAAAAAAAAARSYEQQQQQAAYYNTQANSGNNSGGISIPPPISISTSSPNKPSPKHLNSPNTSNHSISNPTTATASSSTSQGPVQQVAHMVAPIPKNPARGSLNYGIPAANVVRVESFHSQVSSLWLIDSGSSLRW